jgi:membrane-bound serine protease (ClpP class)
MSDGGSIVRQRSTRHRSIAVILIGLGVLLGLLASPAAELATARAASAGAVVVMPADGEVDNVMAGAIESNLATAAEGGAAVLVIRLNTPGGSLESTQRIVSAILAAKVPTIVWVAPAGGFAASAGTFITLSANLAFMAPGTRIGAASPIDGSGNDIPGTLGVKIRNDAIAWIRSIAQERGRPADWAAETVSAAKSSSAAEAVTVGAVDGMAATIEDVIAAADGRTVKVAGADHVLALRGAPVEEVSVNPLAGVLALLADPNVAFILFTIGALALLFELQAPTVLLGVGGVTAIALATIGFVNLPVDAAGLLLVAIGLILLALEPAIPSHGILTIGGVAAFVLGGSALYTQPNGFGPAVRVALPLLVIAAATAAAFGILITTTALRTRRMAAPFGTQPASLAAGTIGEVRRPLEPLGSIYAAGEEWSARTADERPLPRGTPVRVVRTDGLTLVVESDPIRLG